MAQYDIVGSITKRNLVEVVLVHELVEDVGTEDHRAWYGHLNAWQLVHLRVALDDVVEESQTTSLTTERAVADACKVAIGIELAAVEDGNDTYVLHLSILHNGVEDNLAVGLNVLQLMPCDVLEESRYGKYGSCTEPTAHVVARDVVEHGVVGNLEDVVLQLFQRVNAHHLFVCLWVAENEVAKSHMPFHKVAEVNVHLLRVLVDEAESLLLCLKPVVAF